tara:strand:+ start:67 stop:2859 length:2793 start_codon:yes stop_codon:yes gene_type:complete
MRVQRIDTPCFGNLSGRSFEFGEGVTVVLGPNEAGKTTFHTAFETLLYGFEPANREQHPLATWNLDVTLHLEGVLEPDHGNAVRVERLLQSAPTFRTGVPGEDFESKRERNNAPLSEVQSIPRALYRSVYSLEAGETLNVGDDVKEHINELLLGETGLKSALPLHEVRTKLFNDRQALWRNDNRGVHRSADLRKAIKDAGRAYNEARSTAKAAHKAEAERAEVQDRLQELRSRRVVLTRSLEDAEFARNLADLERRRAALSPRAMGSHEDAPRREPAEIEAERSKLESKLEAPRIRLATAPLEVSAQDEAWLSNAEAIEALLEASREHKSTQRRIEDLQRDRSEAHRSAVDALVDLGAKPDTGLLHGLPMARLKAEAKRWREHEPVAVRTSGTTGLVLAGIGIACVLISLIPAVPSALAIGVLLVVPAILQSLGKHESPSAVRPEDALSVLEPLGLEPRDAAELDDLLRDLELARLPLVQAGKADDQCRELEAAWNQHESMVQQLVQTLQLDASLDTPRQTELMLRKLTEARARAEAARDDLAERRSCQALLDTHSDALEALITESEQARAFLSQGWPDRPELADAWNAWKQELKDFHQFESREAELKADPRWGTIEPASTAIDDLQAEQDALNDEIEQAVKDENQLTHQIDGDPDEVARVHEDYLSLQAELDAVRVQRDRLALLEAILNLAEIEHRGAHQPPVLKRASEYLATITGDRYSNLDYLEGPSGKLSVRVHETGERTEVGAPLSRGTQEQIYVCLRLGTLDYLDRGREALPLVLDEALVHWDEVRRAALYPVLQKIAERRQVVLFTCHEWMADEARDLMDARVVDLADTTNRSLIEIPTPPSADGADGETAEVDAETNVGTVTEQPTEASAPTSPDGPANDPAAPRKEVHATPPSETNPEPEAQDIPEAVDPIESDSSPTLFE